MQQSRRPTSEPDAAGQAHRADERGADGRIVRSATGARQGEIIPGKSGIWIWIASFVVIALMLIVLAF